MGRLSGWVPPIHLLRWPALRRGVAVRRGGLYAGEDDLLSVWSIDSAQLRETFFELSALGEPSGDGIVSTAVPEVLFDVLERGDAT